MRSDGNAGKRHREKHQMPQARCYDRAARDAAIHPAILEEAAAEEFSRRDGPADEHAEAASQALAEFTPADAELRFLTARQAREVAGSFGLTQEVEGIDDLVCRHAKHQYTARKCVTRSEMTARRA